MSQVTTSPQATETIEQVQEMSLSGGAASWALPVPLAMTFDELLSHDDTPDETADDIIHAIWEWRDAATPRGLD
jgi:hypothetical protein